MGWAAPFPNPPEIAAEPGSRRVLPARRSPAPPAPERDPAALPPANELSRTASPAAVTRAKPKPSSAARALPPTLEQELGLLDRARSDFAAGDSSGALARLDEYEQAAKNGRLAVEARLLRIQVLAKAGKRARAAELARQFIAEYPDSPLTDRARTYAGVASGDEHSQGGRQ